MPVLLYGCENWILKERLISQLNSFLVELAKRCLGWPKHHSNTAAQVALDLESIRSRLLFTKLGFLRRSMLNDAGVGAEMMRVMSDNVESLCLVKECRELDCRCVHVVQWIDKLTVESQNPNRSQYAQVYGKERASTTRNASESDSRVALLCC